MDIEAVAAESPEALIKRHIDPTVPFDAAAARPIVDAAGLDEDVRDQVAAVLAKLAEVATAEDATLIEVNPLIVTAGREVVALDAKVTIDGNALFRHQDLAEIADTVDDPQEAMAKEKGLTYVKLDGNVGILANGAGLCMSTLDVVAQAGGAPANFLDAGRRLQSRGDRQRLGSDRLRREGDCDPLQHLRRHHPLRRDRQRHRHRVGPARPRGAAGRAPRRHQLRGGAGDPRRRRACPTCTRRRRCSTRRAAWSSWRGRPREHHRRRGDEARRLRPHRPRGLLPRPAQPRLRDRSGRRRHPRQGRPGRRGRADLRHDLGVGRGGRRQYLDDLRPGALRRRRRSTRRSSPAFRR